jgi:chaperonin GroES
MSLNIKPLGDRVVVEAAPAETKTASGIYIPETAQEKPQHGTVVATGPGKYAEQTGNLIPLSVKEGDKVLYGKFAGQEITIDGNDYLIMRESDIYVVL